MPRYHKPDEERRNQKFQVLLTLEQAAFVTGQARREERSAANWLRNLIKREMERAGRSGRGKNAHPGI